MTATILAQQPLAMAAPKVVLIVGGSRGIGAQLAYTFAKSGHRVAVCSKTTAANGGTSKLKGDVNAVAARAAEVFRESHGVPASESPAIGFKCDARSQRDIEAAVARTVDTFGRLDALIYNAGAIYWDKVANTSMKKVQLLHEVNYAGCFAATLAALPVMKDQKRGRLLFVSPPIYSRFVYGKAAYAASKMSMSLLAMGLSRELLQEGEATADITVNCMWPATAIESEVTSMMRLPREVMRRPDIFADACLAVCNSDSETGPRGQTLLDEDYLRLLGATDEDILEYSCVDGAEVPRMMPEQFPDLRVEDEDGAALPSPVGTSDAADIGLSSRAKL